MMSGIPKEKILETVEEIFNELAPGIQVLINTNSIKTIFLDQSWSHMFRKEGLTMLIAYKNIYVY